jgi:urease accessory protein
MFAAMIEWPQKDQNVWLIWQIADSAFPTGGFAHSSGLEAAWQHGEIRNSSELLSFVEASLHQLGRSALPFVTAAHAEPKRFDGIDAICDAFTSNHVANRASRVQGRAFLAAAQRIVPALAEVFDRGQSPASGAAQVMCGHFAPVFGSALGRLGISKETACRLFFFNHLRGTLAAAVRLNVVGPMEAQALQYRMASLAQQVIARCEDLSLDDLAQTGPLLDLWQGAQDRLYSRLFQS